MKVDFTNETVFSFAGPNLCLLGTEDDFRNLSEAILELTDPHREISLELLHLNFLESVGQNQYILFSSKENSNLLGVFNHAGQLIFELDSRYWERIFKYFTLLSWSKRPTI